MPQRASYSSLGGTVYKPCRAITAAAVILASSTLACLQGAGAAADGAVSPLTAPSLSAALALARSSGQQVDVLDQISQRVLTIANPNGSVTATLSAGPAREPDASAPSGWTPIDTMLSTTGESVRPAVSAAPIAFSNGGDGPLAILGTGASSDSITEPWVGNLPDPIIQGATATYPNVYPGVDFVLRAESEGFEQSWVINSRSDVPSVLNVPLSLKGLTPVEQPDGSVALEGANGAIEAAAQPAIMWDSAIDPTTDQPAHLEQLPTDLVRTPSGGYMLQVTPDAAFLNAATFPVTIDPTSGLSVTTDTYVDNSHPTGEFQDNALLKVGDDGLDNNQLQRSLLSFPTDSLVGAEIDSATLSLFETYSGSCTPTQVDVYNLTTPWDGTVTWDTQPTIGDLYASSDTGVGWGGVCPAATVNIASGGAGSNTLAALVQGWANGSLANNGIEIRADNESDPTAYKRFNSSDYGANPPSLSVTYTPTLTVSAAGPEDGDTIDETSPAFFGTVTDPNGGTGFVDFRLMDSSCSTIIASGSGTTVSPGMDSLWTPPASVSLTPGYQYGYEVQADNGAGYQSGWSSCATFSDYPTLSPTGPADSAVSGSLRPTLKVSVSSDSGVSVSPTFSVYSESDNSLVTSGTGSTVGAGGVSTWKVPAGTLVPSARYYWVASAINAIPTNPQSYYPVPITGASVVVTAPLENDVIGGAPTLSASTYGLDAGSVTSVQFYVDGAAVGIATSAPWSIVFGPDGTSGTHAITAVASGTVGGVSTTATSGGVDVTYTNADQEAAQPGWVDSAAAADPSDPPTPFTTTPPAADLNGPNSSGDASVSLSRIADYAIRYALTYNPTYIAFSNDCTNFASQALRYGGWGFSYIGNDSQIWYYIANPNPHLVVNSRSWSVVNGLYSFAITSGRASLDTHSVWDAVPGDILMVDWNGGSAPVDHTMLVTDRTYGSGGNIYLSYHTTNRRDFPLFAPYPGAPWYDSVMGIEAHYGRTPKFWLLKTRISY